MNIVSTIIVKNTMMNKHFLIFSEKLLKRLYKEANIINKEKFR